MVKITIAARALVVGLLVSPVVWGGCSSSNSSSGNTSMQVTDTLGNVFNANCSNYYCALQPVDTLLAPLSCESDPNGGTELFAIVSGTQLMTAHAIFNPASGGDILLNPAEPAHPIACTTNADCLPSVFASSPYTCQSGLCQSSQPYPLLTVDVVALCQYDIPWPNSCPYLTNPKFASRMAEVAAACGSQTECPASAIPADCRQITGPAPELDGGVAPGIDAGEINAGIDAGTRG